MNRILKAIIASTIIIGTSVSMSGCESLPFVGGVKAETYRQRIVQAELAFQTVASRALAYQEADKLTDDQVNALSGLLSSSATMLDAASEAERAGLPHEFDMKIAIFETLLQQAVFILDSNEDIVGI